MSAGQQEANKVVAPQGAYCLRAFEHLAGLIWPSLAVTCIQHCNILQAWSRLHPKRRKHQDGAPRQQSASAMSSAELNEFEPWQGQCTWPVSASASWKLAWPLSQPPPAAILEDLHGIHASHTGSQGASSMDKNCGWLLSCPSFQERGLQRTIVARQLYATSFMQLWGGDSPLLLSVRCRGARGAASTAGRSDAGSQETLGALPKRSETTLT